MRDAPGVQWLASRPAPTAEPLERSPGRLIGVSLGPGDPGLITRAAWSLLERRDAVWAYPSRSARHESYALGIVQRAALAPPVVHGALHFPMTHDADVLGRAWQRGAEAIVPWLRAGRDVLFLVEGDAGTYASFGHLARALNESQPDIVVQRLPGIPAPFAAAATCGMPVAEQDDTVGMVPAAYGVALLDRLLDDLDTLVLMKVKPVLDDLIDWLQQRELLDGTVFVERCGAPDERIVRGRQIAALRGSKVNYLSLMVVRHARRVRGELRRGCLRAPAPPAASPSPSFESLHAPGQS